MEAMEFSVEGSEDVPKVPLGSYLCNMTVNAYLIS